jgi:hypothetical protein
MLWGGGNPSQKILRFLKETPLNACLEPRGPKGSRRHSFVFTADPQRNTSSGSSVLHHPEGAVAQSGHSWSSVVAFLVFLAALCKNGIYFLPLKISKLEAGGG